MLKLFKNKFYLSLILISIFSVNLCKAEEEIFINLDPQASIAEIREELAKTSLPVLSFTFENNEYPTYDVIDHPEGCFGKSIINNSYVNGSLVITKGEEEIYNSGNYQEKESGVRVKNRGNTSTAQDYILKKSYKIKLSKKADLLFRDNKIYKDKDWILLSGNKDLHYAIGTQIARICGIDWEPSGQSVCVIMNDKYMGYFYLVESVKASEGRVNIQDNGFILENDAYWWKPDELYFKSNFLPYAVGWTFKEPDPDDVDSETILNIKKVLDTFEEALYHQEILDYMYDKESFANWILAHDILGTIDGLGSNIFITKENYNSENIFETKLKMGPLWDFDDCFKSEDNDHAAIFFNSHFWYRQLFLYSDFYETLLDRWNQVKDILIDELKPYVENYLELNPDIYIARLIDDKLNLLGRTPLSEPKQELEEKINWIEDRIKALENLYQEIKILKIVLNPSSLEINKGETYQIEALIYPDIATSTNLEWTSSDPNIVKVSDSGEISALASGSSIITASCNGVSSNCEITVYDYTNIENSLLTENLNYSVYSLDGILIKKDCKEEDLKLLKKGIYVIVSGKNRYKIYR